MIKYIFLLLLTAPLQSNADSPKDIDSLYASNLRIEHSLTNSRENLISMLNESLSDRDYNIANSIYGSVELVSEYISSLDYSILILDIMSNPREKKVGMKIFTQQCQYYSKSSSHALDHINKQMTRMTNVTVISELKTARDFIREFQDQIGDCRFK